MLRLSVFLLLFVYQFVSYASSANDVLSARLAKIDSMQADFTQTITDRKDKPVQKSVGHMSLQRPSKFRWSVTKPTAQVVVANGKRLWIYDPDLEQVTIRSLSKEIGETPALLLSNTQTTLASDFNVKMQQDKNGGLQWFFLIPKNQNSMLALIKLGFANNQIREMHLEDHLGHITNVEFYNILMNAKLSASLFDFKPPKHVDVIDETKRR